MASSQDKTEDKSLLNSVAESIGSTLGAIAAKASAVPAAVSHSSLLRTVEREGKKLVGKSKTAPNVPKRVKGRKSEKTTSSKKRVARSARRKK
jgi:hypothetical protein